MNRRVLSIFWHSVDPVFTDGGNPTVAVFQEQIAYLTKRYTPITISEFLEFRRDKGSARYGRKPPVLLGFDDGFKNVIRHALPVLEEFRVPAVFFVIGEVLKNPYFVPWYVERKHLLRRAIKNTVAYRNLRFELSLREDRAKLRYLFDASFTACKSDADRQRILTEFANALAVKRPSGTDLDEDLRFVDRNDLAELASSSMLTVASHAMTHRDLAQLSNADQAHELTQSDLVLRSHCRSYFPVIAYPNGSFNSDTIVIARRIYHAGFAVLLGSSYRDLYAYPRIGLGHNSVRELAYTISAKRRNCILPVKRLLHVTGIRSVEAWVRAGSAGGR